MGDLSIGMRVRATPKDIPGINTTWSGLTGRIVGFPGEGNVRIAFDGGGHVTCGPDDLTRESEAEATDAARVDAARRAALEAHRERSVGSDRLRTAGHTGVNQRYQGLVGRMVMVEVKRGEVVDQEPCEVVACQAAGEYGNWKVLVATREGHLLDVGYTQLRLIADPDAGPYR